MPVLFQSFKFGSTLLRRGSQLSSIVCFIIARVAADGPGPLKPVRRTSAKESNSVVKTFF